MRNDIHVEVLSDPKLLQSLRALVRCYAHSQGFGKDRVDEIVLAVDEACTNAMRHAYEGRCDECIEMFLRANGEHVEFELRDCGKPAPPEALAPRPLEKPSLDALRPGGLGVQLIHQVFDSVEFEPGATAGNRVVMRLVRPPRAK